MKYIEHRLFIKKDGIKYYKTDSFWSLSKDPEHAKRHYCPGYITESLLRNLDAVLNWDKDKGENNVEKYPLYNNALIGYEDPETNESTITNQILADGKNYRITASREKKLKRILKK